MKEEQVLFKSIREESSDFQIRVSTARILDLINKGGKSIFMAFKNTAFSSEDQNIVVARPVTLANGKTILGDQLTLELPALKGITATSETPQWTQIRNPELLIVNNYQAIQWDKKSKQAENFERYVPSIIVYPGQFLTKEQLEQLPQDSSTHVVVKPERGMQGSNVNLVAKNLEEINKAIEAIRISRIFNKKKDIPILIQQFMPSLPIDSLQGATPEAQKYLEDIKFNCEVRVYVSLGPDLNDGNEYVAMHAIGRHVNPFEEQDEWIHLKQEFIPQDIFNIAVSTAKQVMKQAEANGMFIAVDVFFNQQYWIREVNIQDPMIPGEKNNPTDSAIVTAQYANIFK